MGFIIIIGAIKDKVGAFFVITALFICCFHHFFVLSQSQRDLKDANASHIQPHRLILAVRLTPRK